MTSNCFDVKTFVDVNKKSVLTSKSWLTSTSFEKEIDVKTLFDVNNVFEVETLAQGVPRMKVEECYDLDLNLLTFVDVEKLFVDVNKCFDVKIAFDDNRFLTITTQIC